MWVSGSPSRSMIDRSTSVFSPAISRRTFLAGLRGQLADQSRHALEHGVDLLRAHRHDAVLELAGVMNDLVENLHQPAADVFRKAVHDLPEHRLGDDQFADHVDDAVDLFELDARRGRAGRPRFRGAARGCAPASGASADGASAGRSRRRRRERRRGRISGHRSATARAPRSARRRQSSAAGSAAPAAGSAALSVISSSQSPATNSNTSSICSRVAAVRNVPVQPI